MENNYQVFVMNLHYYVLKFGVEANWKTHGVGKILEIRSYCQVGRD